MKRLFDDIDLSKITYGKYKSYCNLNHRQSNYENHYQMFLMYCQGKSVEEIGNEYDLTTVRIRQILQKIHRQLRIIISQTK
jgi:DNA-directed RNA polymerase sigma subunit (sigma70/sigma32)